MEIKQPASSTRFYYGYTVVIVSTLIFVVSFGVNYTFGIFFKPLVDEFGWTRALTSGAVALSWIMQAVGAIAMGALNDKKGPRLVLSLSGFILGIGYLLMSQVHNLWQLYLVYGVIVGIGLSGIFIPLTSTVARWFTTKRGAMTGIVVAGIGVGTLIGPLLANGLIVMFDWRVSYAVLGIAVFVIVISAAQFLKLAPAKSTTVQDKNSSAEINARGMLLGDAIRCPQFWMLSAMNLCFGICLYTILVHLVPYAIDLDMAPAKAAGLLSTIGGISILGKMIFGKTGDRFGSRTVYLISFVILAISFVLLLSIKEVSGLYIFAGIFGLGYSGCVVVQSPIIAEFFGLKNHGAIFGILNAGFTIGGAFGPVMAGYIFDTFGSYRLAFVIAVGLVAVAIVLTLALKPIRSRSV